MTQPPVRGQGAIHDFAYQHGFHPACGHFPKQTARPGHQSGQNFWAKIEKLAPNQPDLHLPPELYERWREQMRYLDDGVTLRVDPDSPLMAVRALYFDLRAWALP